MRNFYKISLLFLFLCLVRITPSYAGDMPRYYQPKPFSYASNVIATEDNGFLMLAYNKNSSTDPYVPSVTKFDQKGDIQWQRQLNLTPLYDFSGVDEGRILKANNGYIVFQTYPTTTNNGRLILVQRYDRNWNLVYTSIPSSDSIGVDETFLNGWNLSLDKLQPLPDGGFIIAGTNISDCYNKGIIYARYSPTGTLVWKHRTPLTNTCVQFRYDQVLVHLTQDNNFLLGIGNRYAVSGNNYDALFQSAKFDFNDNLQWSKAYYTTLDVSQTANKNIVLYQKEIANGNIKMLTNYDVNGGDYARGIFLQYTLNKTDGSVIQTDTIVFNLPLPNDENFRKIVIDDQENILVLGQKSFTKLDKKGNVIWQKTPFNDISLFDVLGTKYHLTSFSQTSNGNYILVGNNTQTTNTNNSGIYLFLITANGQSKIKAISGKVFMDNDRSCTYNTTEKGYPGGQVKAERNGQTAYATTDTAGNYYLPLDSGIYNVSAQLPNSTVWRLCYANYVVNLTGTQPLSFLNIPLYQRESCPFLQVEIATPYLRKCAENSYSVYYCNTGTDTARNAYIDVLLDKDMTFTHATNSSVALGNNKYRFYVGNVEPQNCKSFLLYANLSCDVVSGKTHCTSAHIYPDNVCMPTTTSWDGSDIHIYGYCDGDTAVVVVKNSGSGDMQAPRKYIVIEGDFLRIQPQNYLLVANDSLIIKVKADGKTIRVSAQQDPNFPYPSNPSITIESCTPAIDSLGLVNQFSQDDAAAFISTSCVQNRSSYDPNEKTAQPTGYLLPHYVEHGTEIEYTLRFQNTGTDTAFFVELLDTLSPLLELNTLVMGASSHPYTYTVYGGKILQVNFNGIILPDSTVNEPDSHGFVTFHVQPKSTAPNGSIINNDAQIYFDYNRPVSTNTIFHTIDSIQYKLVSWVRNSNVLNQFNVFPNPFTNSAHVVLQSSSPLRNAECIIYDISGRFIRSQKIEQTFDIDGSILQDGLYILKIISGEEVIATAKLLKQ